MKLLFLFSFLFFIFSCESFKHESRHCKIHFYQTGTGDDLVYWYILYGNNHSYYIYESSMQISDFSSISWSKGSTIPEQLDNIQEIGQIDEPLSQLPDEIEVDMSDQQSSTEINNTTNESLPSPSEVGSDPGADASGSSGTGDE